MLLIMNKVCRLLAFSALVVAWSALSGCTTPPPPPAPERIILLPGADGKVGKITVTPRNGPEIKLETAYASAQLTNGVASSIQTEAESVKQRYSAVLQATPIPVKSFTLLFVLDRVSLLPESRAVLQSMLQDYKSRPAPEVLLIGHTDRSGDTKYNLDLSKRRATAVRDLLVAGGVDPAVIDTAWRGDREPLFFTPGKTYDVRNRRVEVKLR